MGKKEKKVEVKKLSLIDKKIAKLKDIIKKLEAKNMINPNNVCNTSCSRARLIHCGSRCINRYKKPFIDNRNNIKDVQ